MRLSVNPELEKQIIALADATGHDPQQLTDVALRHFVENEARIIADIRAGIEATDRGDTVPHDQVMAEIEPLLARADNASK